VYLKIALVFGVRGVYRSGLWRIEMSIEQYLIFLSITGLFMASPGPAILLCINNGIQHGIRLSAFGVMGNVLALQILIVLSAIGIGSILATSLEIFNLVKILGAIYLCYLGIKIWFSPINTFAQKDAIQNRKRPFYIFQHAFLVTATNPKAFIYVSALLPQFLDIDQPLLVQLLSLNVGIGVLQFIIFMSYVILSSRARIWLNNEMTRKLFNRVTAVTFVGFGIALGLSEPESSKL
jgi:homoserine/homoserine lactone efflux protein